MCTWRGCSLLLRCVCLCGPESQSRCEPSRLWLFFPLFSCWSFFYFITLTLVSLSNIMFYSPEHPTLSSWNSPAFVLSFSISPNKKNMSARLNAGFIGVSTHEGRESRKYFFKRCLTAVGTASNGIRFTSFCLSFCPFLHKTFCLSCVQVCHSRRWLSNTLTCKETQSEEGSQHWDTLQTAESSQNKAFGCFES